MGSEARDALYEGIKKVTAIVGSTLGPRGMNVAMEKTWGEGLGRTVPTNDGMTIAQNLLYDDEIENMGAQMIIETALRTNEMVGDGTTTATVLTKAIIDEAKKRIKKYENDLTKRIDTDV